MDRTLKEKECSNDHCNNITEVVVTRSAPKERDKDQAYDGQEGVFQERKPAQDV